jgi:uncharacterized RmlC-like cupin family protein
MSAGDDEAAGHRRLEHVSGSQLSPDTAQTSGMRRFAAISGSTVGSERLWMGRTEVEPGTSSGDHHHGDSETAIFVVSGHPVFVFADHGNGGEDVRIETAPGDFVFVPPFVAHREENPSADETAVVIIARSSQEAVVVSLPGLSR